MNTHMLVLAAAPAGTLLVAGCGVVLGMMLVVYGLRGRALRLKRAGVAEAPVEDQRIRAMEARVSRLEAIIERTRGEVAQLKELKPARAEPAPDSGAAPTRHPATQAARGLNLAGRPAGDASRLESKPAARSGAGELAPDPDFADIFELADQGLSAADIATKVQRPTGQVELILNLRRHGIGA